MPGVCLAAIRQCLSLRADVFYLRARDDSATVVALRIEFSIAVRASDRAGALIVTVGVTRETRHDASSA